MNRSNKNIHQFALFESVKTCLSAILGRVASIAAPFQAGREIAHHVSSEWASNSPLTNEKMKQVFPIYEKHGICIPSQMPVSNPVSVGDSMEKTTIGECLMLAESELKVANALLKKEISNYPTPIAGCDCQFNHLLNERRKIEASLSALQNDLDQTG